MAAALDDILPGVLALPDDSKLLAERLLEIVSAKVALDADLLSEVARRAAAQTDPSLLVPGEDVLREVRAEVAARAVQP